MTKDQIIETLKGIKSAEQGNLEDGTGNWRYIYLDDIDGSEIEIGKSVKDWKIKFKVLNKEYIEYFFADGWKDVPQELVEMVHNLVNDL